MPNGYRHTSYHQIPRIFCLDTYDPTLNNEAEFHLNGNKGDIEPSKYTSRFVQAMTYREAAIAVRARPFASRLLRLYSRQSERDAPERREKLTAELHRAALIGSEAESRATTHSELASGDRQSRAPDPEVIQTRRAQQPPAGAQRPEHCLISRPIPAPWSVGLTPHPLVHGVSV